MLYKIVEGWRLKETERQQVVHQLQLDKHSMQRAFESQQQVLDHSHNTAWQLDTSPHKRQPFDAHCCHMGTAIKHPVPDWVIRNFRHPGTLMLSPESRSAQMSKITNDGLTRPGTG